jgi:hypothetical protein
LFPHKINVIIMYVETKTTTPTTIPQEEKVLAMDEALQICERYLPNTGYPASPVRKNSHNEKKTVSFSKDVRIDHTLTLKQYSAEERNATWYNREELTNVKKENYRTIMFIDHNIEIDTRRDSIRGLEYLTRKWKASRMDIKSRAMAAVLVEQNDQKCQGSLDVDKLAQCYSKITDRCSHEAFIMGGSDEKNACNLMANSSKGSSKQRNQMMPSSVHSPRMLSPARI